MKYLEHLCRLDGYANEVPCLSGRIKIANIEYLDNRQNLYQGLISSEYWILYFFFDYPQDVYLHTATATHITVPANSVLSVRKEQRHKFSFMAGDRPRVLVIYYQLLFGADELQGIEKSYQQDEKELICLFLSAPYHIMPLNERLESELEMTNEYLRTCTKGDVLKVRNQISNMMLTIFQQNRFEKGSAYTEDPHDAASGNLNFVLMRYILESSVSGKSLPQISDELHYTPRHIQRLVTKFYGDSFAKTVMNFRITYVMVLLSDTDFNLREICEKSGFPDEKALNRKFQEFVGISPTRFRKNLSHCLK